MLDVKNKLLPKDKTDKPDGLLKLFNKKEWRDSPKIKMIEIAEYDKEFGFYFNL